MMQHQLHSLRAKVHHYRAHLSARTFLGAFLGLVLLCFVVQILRVPALNLYEDASFALAPTGARAFAYGERHFDGQNPRTYDVDRAEYFFC